MDQHYKNAQVLLTMLREEKKAWEKKNYPMLSNYCAWEECIRERVAEMWHWRGDNVKTWDYDNVVSKFVNKVLGGKYGYNRNYNGHLFPELAHSIRRAYPDKTYKSWVAYNFIQELKGEIEIGMREYRKIPNLLSKINEDMEEYSRVGPAEVMDENQKSIDLIEKAMLEGSRQDLLFACITESNKLERRVLTISKTHRFLYKKLYSIMRLVQGKKDKNVKPKKANLRVSEYLRGLKYYEWGKEYYKDSDNSIVYKFHRNLFTKVH